MQKQDKEIGVLWKRTSLKQNHYLVGKISVNGVSVQIVMFPIVSKNPKSPSFKILLAKLDNELCSDQSMEESF